MFQARKAGLLTDSIVDDAADFAHLGDALGRAGLSPDEVRAFFSFTALAHNDSHPLLRFKKYGV